MIKELEIAVQCANWLPEPDQAKHAEDILKSLEEHGLIDRRETDTIIF